MKKRLFYISLILAIAFTLTFVSARPSQGVCPITSNTNIAFYGQTGFGCGASYEIHNHLMACERLAPPVHADVAEHPVLDLVPLAGSRREVAYRYAQSRLIRKGLKCNLP